MGTASSIHFDKNNPKQVNNNDNKHKEPVAVQPVPSHSFSSHVFLSHNWGTGTCASQKTVDNHARVKEINRLLQQKGVSTWFDEEKMHGNIKRDMSSGILHSCCFISFITQKYVDKVNGTNAEDNCQLEFNFAALTKTADQMIAVVLEKEMRDPHVWGSQVSIVLGGRLYVDMVEITDETINKLVQTIQLMVSQASSSAVGLSPSQGKPEKPEKPEKPLISVKREDLVLLPSSSNEDDDTIIDEIYHETSSRSNSVCKYNNSHTLFETQETTTTTRRRFSSKKRAIMYCSHEKEEPTARKHTTTEEFTPSLLSSNELGLQSVNSLCSMSPFTPGISERVASTAS